MKKHKLIRDERIDIKVKTNSWYDVHGKVWWGVHKKIYDNVWGGITQNINDEVNLAIWWKIREKA